MTFYKSKKLGAFKIGFSTKGIGVSTGVKGLRLGISSSGTPYVSGGIGGFRYRKNLTTSRKSRTRYKKQPKVKLINNYDKNLKEEIEYTNPHNKNEEVKNKYTFEIPQKISKRKRNYLILFFVCLFLSSIKNIFWIPCFLFLFLFIRIKFKLSKCNKLISNTEQFLKENKIDKLEQTLINAKKKIYIKEILECFYNETYSNILNKIIEDNIISEQENKIIDIFRNNLAAEKFTEINSNAIYQIISNILSDSKLSNIEKQQIDSALKILPVSANEVDNINKIVVQFNTVIEIQNKGIDFLEQKESFNGKTCLYKNRIVKVVKHIKKGQATFEEDGECNLYIDNDFLHFVSEGHKKISIKQIINTELQDDIVVFTIENRQRPIYLKSSDGLLIISIIASLKTS